MINERGYDAANFQAIASRAGLSRPTMHYYFHTREEIYDRLVAETYSIVVDCIARANREDTLLDQLSAFVTAAYRSGLVDGSMIRFTVMARHARDPSSMPCVGFMPRLSTTRSREVRFLLTPMPRQW